jgi:electron transport complex protein RnfC
MRDVLTFKGGIHPLKNIQYGKSLSENSEIMELPAGAVVKIPVLQHIGAPGMPVVGPGDDVLMGQKIADANGFVSVPCYASVSGKVKGIEKIPSITGKPIDAIVIENDGQDRRAYAEPVQFANLEPKELIDIIKEAGIVGMGGATFPLHVKLSPPPEKKVNLLIVNAAECEPFLTADYRLMMEYPKRILYGTRAIMHALGVQKAIIGIEDNKPEAIETMRSMLDTHAIRVVALEAKYPQGSEKQMIDAITGRVVPSGGLPMDVGVVVANAGSVKAVADRLIDGEPLIRRVVTVTGAVARPSNFMARIGMSVQEVIDAAGGFSGEPLKIVMGGPMMGLPVPDLACTVTKGTSGIVVLDKSYLPKREVESECIYCGKCAQACPIHLMPMKLLAYSAAGDLEKCAELHAQDCMSCGSCSYVCPAKKHIAQYIKLAKDEIAAKKAANNIKKS